MDHTHPEMGVATGETAEPIYDGAYFLQQYVETAANHQEAARLLARAKGITRDLVEKLMNPQTGEPLYRRGSQVPEHSGH